MAGVAGDLSCLSPQDSRSEHERQYLLCQGSSGVENTELVKSPRWDWLVWLEAPLPLACMGRVKEGHCPGEVPGGWPGIVDPHVL